MIDQDEIQVLEFKIQPKIILIQLPYSYLMEFLRAKPT